MPADRDRLLARGVGERRRIRHQGEDVVPIPGTRRIERLDENTAAADIELSEKQLGELDELFSAGVAAGDRYAPPGMQSVEL